MEESSAKFRIALAMEYPLLQQGGMEVLIRELILRLAGRFEIVLVSNDQNKEALGQPFADLIAAHISWNRYTSTPQAARELATALKDNHVQLAHFHGGQYDWHCARAWLSPIYYLADSVVPCLVTNHLAEPLLMGYCRASRPAWQRALLLPKAWMSRALIMGRLQAEVLVSKHDYEQMRRNFPPFAGKLRQFYHSKLRRDDRGLPMGKRKKIVLCLGTFCERKGQVILTRAFASIANRHPEWSLHMMGRCEKPDYLAEVKAIAAGSGFSDRILISPPENDPSPFLESASIFAMPSLIEPLGLSLQEALYYECACIGSDVGGIPELIENEATGLLVPPGDEKALAAALDRLISEPELRMRLTSNARHSIVDKGMLAEMMTEKYIQLYMAILTGKARFQHQ